MKRITAVLGISVFLCATPFLGQCFGYGTGSPGYCSSSGCFMQFIQLPPTGEEIVWTSYTISCCGTFREAWSKTRFTCNVPISAKKKSSMELLLGDGIHLMARDCLGRPVIYNSPAALIAQDSTPAIDLSLPDRLLSKDLLKGLKSEAK